MQKHDSIVLDDEIDIYKIWSMIVKRKLMILTVTLIAAITAAVYAWAATPLYSGTVLIEIGEVIYSNENVKNNGSSTVFNNNYSSTTISYLDNMNTLKEVTAQISGLKVEVLNGTPNMLRISTEGPDKSTILSNLDNAVQFILQRHAEKAKLYQNDDSKIKMTQVIGKINISDAPIKPKKESIITVALISGLIFGLFIAFTAEFLQRGRKKRE